MWRRDYDACLAQNEGWLDSYIRPWICWFQSEFLGWLHDWFLTIVQFLDPAYWFNLGLIRIAEYLPSRYYDLELAFLDMELGFYYAAKYISVLDYFMNLPFLYMTLGTIIAIESALTVVRMYRFVISLIPGA